MSQTHSAQSMIESKMISEHEEELNNFYHQMDISPNPSFSNLDGCLFERYYTPQNQIPENGNSFITPYKVKNILACYQEDNYDSRNDLDIMAINQNQQGSENLLKKAEHYNSPSPSSNNQRNQGETSSPYFDSFHQDYDLANDLSSTEKFDFLDMCENSTYKQKLNYTIDVEDFMLNCTPNPFTAQAQKGAERIFINKRIGEMKKKKLITKKLFNKYQQKNEEAAHQQQQTYLHGAGNDTSNILNTEPNTLPHKILKKEVIREDTSIQIEEEAPNQVKTSSQDKDMEQVSQSIISKLLQINNNYQQTQQSQKSSSSSSTSSQEPIKNNGSLKMSTIPCKCRKSLCLKLYCECFARGEICGPACICLECRNSTHYLEQRNTAIKQIESKNPSAFLFASVTVGASNNSDQSSAKGSFEQSQMLAEVRRGCNCKKSKCRKKYCECYMVGKQCTSLCQCVDCTNNVPHSHSPSSPSQSPQLQHESSQILQQQPQFVIKNDFSLAKAPTHQSDSSEISNCYNQDDQSLLPLLKNFNKMTDQKEIERSNKLSSQLKQINKKVIPSQNVSDQNCGKNKICFLTQQHQKDISSDKLHHQKFTTTPTTNSISSKENKIIMKTTKKIVKAKKINSNVFQ